MTRRTLYVKKLLLYLMPFFLNSNFICRKLNIRGGIRGDYLPTFCFRYILLCYF